jgi:hypothetical protein
MEFVNHSNLLLSTIPQNICYWEMRIGILTKASVRSMIGAQAIPVPIQSTPPESTIHAVYLITGLWNEDHWLHGDSIRQSRVEGLYLNTPFPCVANQYGPITNLD